MAFFSESLPELTKINEYMNRHNTVLSSAPVILPQIDNYYLLVENTKSSIIKIIKITQFYICWKIISEKNTISNKYTLCSEQTQKNIHPSVLSDLQSKSEIYFYLIDISYTSSATPERSIEPPQPNYPERSFDLPQSLRSISYTTPIRLFPQINPDAPNRQNRNSIQYHILDLPRAELFAGQSARISETQTTRFPSIQIKPSEVEQVREDGSYVDNITCKICFVNKINIAYIPCGHLYCSECDTKLTKHECPTCRKKIISRQAIFM